ncbi:hypothetical protein COCOBI_pt-1820 (chloroplast) [Coccomyxa sp. Obi]|nr:hypothetical protein COCOBI_pt-1820 [Coccomyxa sp. Obi]
MHPLHPFRGAWDPSRGQGRGVRWPPPAVHPEGMQEGGGSLPQPQPPLASLAPDGHPRPSRGEVPSPNPPPNHSRTRPTERRTAVRPVRPLRFVSA